MPEKSSALKHSQADSRKQTGTPIPSTPEPEPSIGDVLALIEKLSAKQVEIERKKNDLKNELINRIWQL